MSAEGIAAAMIGAALTLPLVETGRQIARMGEPWVPMTANLGMVLINLCGLVPIVCFWAYVKAVFQNSHGLQISMPEHILLSAFPMPVWRIDTVALMLLALLQVPIGQNKWQIGRIGGCLLMFVYIVYMGVTLILPRSW